MLDRKEEHLATGNRPSAAARVKAGVSADGMLTAFDAESWGTGGAGAAAGFPLPYIYQFPNRRRTHKDVYINTGQQRPMRAPGHPQGSFITEVLMEELADRVKMDPVEFRIKNLPPEAPNAMWRSYLRKGAEEFGWDKRHPTGDPTPGPIKTGMGVAINTWGGGGRGPSQARCEISSDGAGRRPGRHPGPRHRHADDDRGHCGRHVRPAGECDSAGDRRHDVPNQRRVGRQHDRRGGAVRRCGSRRSTRSTPSRRRSRRRSASRRRHWSRPAAASRSATTRRRGCRGATRASCSATQPISVEGNWQPGLSSVTTSGVQFAEVTVDVETGIVKVMRVLAIQDCGLVVSRLTAESQVYGGVIGSLNFALFEDRILDRNTGQMVNPNMEWYLLAGMSDMPKIDVRLMDQPERGVVGIGEPPTVSTAAAITNAVRNAIGVTVRSLPLTPAKILQTLAQRQA